MKQVSRRELANYAVNRLTDGSNTAQLGRQLAAELASSNHSGAADMLIDDIYLELERRQQLAVAHVTTARTASPAVIKQVEKLVSDLTGAKTVTTETQIDPSVIGGVRVETATRHLDMTVRGKLTQLKKGTH